MSDLHRDNDLPVVSSVTYIYTLLLIPDIITSHIYSNYTEDPHSHLLIHLQNCLNVHLLCAFLSQQLRILLHSHNDWQNEFQGQQEEELQVKEESAEGDKGSCGNVQVHEVAEA